MTLERIKTFINQGGESTIPSVYLLPPTTLPVIKGKAAGLSLGLDSVYNPSVVQEFVFENSGIWTSAVQTRIFQTGQGYWLEGLPDSEGFIWVVDIGIVSALTGRYIFYEQNTPLNYDGSYKVERPIPSGKKVIRLKRVDQSTVTTIHQYVVEDLTNKLVRTEYNSLADYTSQDQSVSLEELSKFLLSFTYFRYQSSEDNEVIYYQPGESNPFFSQILDSQFNLLASFISQSPGSRFGSIPASLPTYSTAELLYNEELYSNTQVLTLEPDVFATGVYEIGDRAPLLPDRRVSNRAVAWFLLALTSYKVSFNSYKYDTSIEQVADYLSRQVGPQLLVREGWTNAIPVSTSTQLTESTFSTSAISAIAFLKVYEATKNTKYLELVSEIVKSIEKYFCNRDLLTFSHSLSNSATTAESWAYSYMLFSFLSNSFWLGAAQEKLLGLCKFDYMLSYSSQSPGSATGILAGYESGDRQRNISEALLILELVQYNRVNNSKLQDALINLVRQVTLNPEFNLVATSYLMRSNTLATVSIPLEEFRSHQFYWDFIYQKMASYIPVEFNWFTKEALTISSVLGKLLYSVSKPLASLFSRTNSLNKTKDLLNLTGLQLSEYVRAASIDRYPQETDEELRARYIRTLSRDSLQDFFSVAGITVEVSEYWRKVLVINTFEVTAFETAVAEGHFKGSKYSPNSVEITLDRPYSNSVDLVLEAALPMGVAAHITGTALLQTSKLLEVPVAECMSFDFVVI